MKKAAGILASLALVLILLVSSVEMVVYNNAGYFEKEYLKYDVQQNVDITMENLLLVTEEMMSYLRGHREDLDIVTTIASEEREFFSDREKAHMEDVKALFVGGIRIRLLCLVLVGATLLWACLKGWLSLLAKCFLITASVLLLATGVITAVVSTNFNRYFTVFHELFFNNDLWILDPATDLLINIVPLGFFIDTAVRIVIVFGVLLAACSGVCYFIAKQKYWVGIALIGLLLIKFFGIILLIILALVLFILFIPIKYRLSGEKVADLKGMVWISWLFGVFQIKSEVNQESGLKWQVKILGRPLLGDGVKKKQRNEKEQTAYSHGAEETVVTTRSRETTQQEEPPVSTMKQPKQPSIEEPQEEPQATACPPRRVKIEELEQPAKELAEPQELEQPAEEPVEELPDDFFEQEKEEKNALKGYFQLFQQIPDKKGLFQAAIRLIKRLLKGVLPRELYMKARIGTGDPALTGYLCGAVGVLKMQFGNHIHVTGDFREATLADVHVRAAGRIVPGGLLYACIRFLFTKSVWRALKQYWKGKR